MSERPSLRELDAQLATLETREDFVRFLGSLLADLEAHRDAPDWENPTLERFLESMAAWLAATGAYQERQGSPLPAQPDWHFVADMFYAAKIYE